MSILTPHCLDCIGPPSDPCTAYYKARAKKADGERVALQKRVEDLEKVLGLTVGQIELLVRSGPEPSCVTLAKGLLRKRS